MEVGFTVDYTYRCTGCGMLELVAPVGEAHMGQLTHVEGDAQGGLSED